MIHVCRLDIGSRHVFDSADGINDVGSLSSAIELHFNILKSKQILIISGGEVLDDYEQKLYRLSAGREESPIYLIDKGIVEKEHPPTIEMPLDNLIQDMKQEIETAIMMRPSYQTLQARSQLAARVYDLGKNLHKLCQSFYDDQYWQYQGFLALIANLDEFVSTFRKRQDLTNEQFDKYLNNKSYFKVLMEDIDKYIDILANVRLLPQIIAQTQLDSKLLESNTTTVNQKPTTLFSSISCQSISQIQSIQLKPDLTNTQLTNSTLLEWIKSTDPQNKLNSVIDETKEMLANFDSNFKWKDLRTKINKLINQFENNPQMKEIEGLTKRLQDLNNFLDKSKKYLAAQCEIAESFASNQERAASLKDESILQDLCKGHQRQLELFKTNHSNMIEITRKISKAKLELIRVIHSRLNWVMQIQKQMADHDFQLQIYFKQLKRINLRLKLMEQLKKAPFIYIYSMKETLRRQHFSKIYKTFAKSFSDLVSRVFKNEMSRRESFDHKIAPLSQHFVLSIMFRSLNDKVESFLNDTVFKFDTQLPQLDESDVNQIELDLKSQISELKFKQSTSFSITSSSSASSGSLSNSQITNPALLIEPSSPNSDIPSTKLINTDQWNDFSNFEMNKNDPDLLLLNNLIDLLNNEFKQIPIVTTTVEPETKRIFDTKIGDIKQKLNETKELLKHYKLELKSSIDLIKRQNEEIEQNKLNFYTKLIDFIQSDRLNKSAFLSQLSKPDQELTNKLLDYLKQLEIDNHKQIDDLKTTIKTVKTTTNADKQIQFNEAIKRVTQDKDKIIEEFKQKEKNYLEQINSLQQSLDAANSLKDVSNDTVLINNDKSLEVQNTEQKDIETEDINQTRMKLRELMLLEKITQLEKQLSLFTTLPVTNDYETIQLHSCNIDDLVIAVYSESYGSYKIIHKSSNYLHFVHSAIFKSHEQRLTFKNQNSMSLKQSQLLASPSSSPINEISQIDIQFPNNDMDSAIASSFTCSTLKSDMNIDENSSQTPNPVVKNSPSDNIHNIFLSEKQPQWFVGRVLVKEFCIARKENNRFRVPSGTRFYRVKLKPYNL